MAGERLRAVTPVGGFNVSVLLSQSFGFSALEMNEALVILVCRYDGRHHSPHMPIRDTYIYKKIHLGK
jgi:hypothetical protein